MTTMRIVPSGSQARPRTRVRQSISIAASLLRRMTQFLGDLARELADENAYARHLSWHQREHSRTEWKAFSDARLGNKYKQGKCC